MAQWISTLPAFLEDPGSSPSTHMVTHNHLQFQETRCFLLASQAPGTLIVHQHTCWQDCYSSERKGFPGESVADLRGKVSSQLGGKEYHKVTPHNKPHTRRLLGETEEGGCLCLGEKQWGTEWEAGFIQGFLGAEFFRMEIFRMETGRFSNSGIGGFSNPKVNLDLLPYEHKMKIDIFKN